MNDNPEQWPPIEGDKTSIAPMIFVVFVSILSAVSSIVYFFL